MKTLVTMLALTAGLSGAMAVTTPAHADERIITERTVVRPEGYRDGYYDGMRYVPRQEFVRVRKTRCWWHNHRKVCRTVWVREPVRHRHYRGHHDQHWNHHR